MRCFRTEFYARALVSGYPVDLDFMKGLGYNLHDAISDRVIRLEKPLDVIKEYA